MNIHEHQAKKILKEYGAVVPEGIFAFTVDELIEKAKSLKTEKFVLKAQIHAGGRGKAGGVKILDTIEELGVAAKKLLGKTLRVAEKRDTSCASTYVAANGREFLKSNLTRMARFCSSDISPVDRRPKSLFPTCRLFAQNARASYLRTDTRAGDAESNTMWT